RELDVSGEREIVASRKKRVETPGVGVVGIGVGSNVGAVRVVGDIEFDVKRGAGRYVVHDVESSAEHPIARIAGLPRNLGLVESPRDGSTRAGLGAEAMLVASIDTIELRAEEHVVESVFPLGEKIVGAEAEERDAVGARQIEGDARLVIA